MLIVGLIVAILILIVYQSVYVVGTNDKVIVYRLGRFSSIKGDGLRFKIPFLDSYRYIGSTYNTVCKTCQFICKDGESGVIEVVLRYHMNIDKLDINYIHDSYLIESIISDSVITVLASKPFKALYEINLIREDVIQTINNRIKQYCIVTDDVLFTFVKQYKCLT